MILNAFDIFFSYPDLKFFLDISKELIPYQRYLQKVFQRYNNIINTCSKVEM